MNNKLFLYIFVPFAFVALDSSAQDLSPGNKIKPSATVYIGLFERSFIYSYTLSNGQASEQAIWQYELYLSPHVSIQAMNSPVRWSGSCLNENGELRIHWGTRTDADIFPGQSLSGYSISSPSIPGIIAYYAEGWVPFPDSVAGGEDDSIPGYTGLTPYGPGVVGKTIGPVSIPDPFSHSAFLDTLASYTQQAYDLQWLGDSHFLSTINRDLTQAKRVLGRGDSASCASKILSFQQTIQEEHTATQHKGKHIPYVSSEAYYLLYYNAQYLVDRLPRSTK